MGEGDPAESGIDLATGVAGVHVVVALLLQVVAHLERGDHVRVVGLGDGQRVAEVVRVAVGEGDGVAPDVAGRHGRHRIAGQERIDGERVVAVAHQEAGVAEEGEFEGHGM